MKVTICGGGIMGTSVAYHLALKGIKSTIVERSGLACSASGKAGGFLARDWCDHYEVGPLARRSFDMHMKQSTDARFQDCDYRRMDTLSVSLKEGAATPSDLPDWLDGEILSTSIIGSTDTSAQVHPYKLTHAYFNAAKDLVGSDLIVDVVTGVTMNGNKVTGVKTENGGTIESDCVVIAMGPWSGEAMKWFNLPTVSGKRAHSVILQPKSPITAHACFMEFRDKSHKCLSPEAYPRPDGTVYICGLSDLEQLPSDPDQVHYNPESCKTLKAIGGTMSKALRDADVITEQACFLPIPTGGLPVIGAVKKVDGVYIATGHSCWGILNSPATGEAIAQLIADGKCRLVDLSPFEPS